MKDYKYLGTIIDDKLKWSKNTNMLYKKGQQRLHLMRQLRKFKVDNKILTVFYESMVLSVISFCYTILGSSLSVKDKEKLHRIVRKSCAMLNVPIIDLDFKFDESVIMLVKRIMSNIDHPLSTEYKFLRSGCRLQSIYSRTTRYNKSFVPSSIVIFNKSCSR